MGSFSDVWRFVAVFDPALDAAGGVRSGSAVAAAAVSTARGRVLTELPGPKGRPPPEGAGVVVRKRKIGCVRQTYGWSLRQR
jgi:hypothetical protein